MNDVIFAIDCETSGMNFKTHDPSVGYQAVSFGVVASDLETFKPKAKLYVEIKWDGVSGWEYKAEKIHGLTKTHLEENGVTKEEAALLLTEFFLDNLPEGKNSIMLLGHNVRAFDIYFLRQLFDEFNIPLKFAHRTLDTLSLGIGTVRSKDSNELFDVLNIKREEPHNALSDALAALKVYRIISTLWSAEIGLTINN